jgi:hypothetical protein
VASDLFDMQLRSLRRDRAFRTGPELFLLERAFDDVLDRLAFVQRRFRSALLIGCPDPGWIRRLAEATETVVAVDPGRLFATSAGAQFRGGDDLPTAIEAFDLCVAIGTLDTANDPPALLRAVREAMAPDSLLIGTISGGDTLPRLRSAMRAADMVTGAAAPHVHPRIEASALTMLLAGAGFAMPVVDVDRVEVAYPSLAKLVADLRGMAATNLLSDRPRRGLSRLAWAAAQADVSRGGTAARTVETFELLNFAAWTPAPIET